MRRCSPASSRRRTHRSCACSASRPRRPCTDVEQTCRLVGQSISALNGLVVQIVEGFHAAYPQFDPAALLTPDALAQGPVVDQKCTTSPTAFANIAATSRSRRTHSTSPRSATILHTNSAGNRPAGAPLLVVQGTADQFVPQSLTDAFVAKACAAGDTVDYRVVCGCDPRRRAQRRGQRRRRLVRRPRQRRARDQYLQSGRDFSGSVSARVLVVPGYKGRRRMAHDGEFEQFVPRPNPGFGARSPVTWPATPSATRSPRRSPTRGSTGIGSCGWSTPRDTCSAWRSRRLAPASRASSRGRPPTRLPMSNPASSRALAALVAGAVPCRVAGARVRLDVWGDRRSAPHVGLPRWGLT